MDTRLSIFQSPCRPAWRGLWLLLLVGCGTSHGEKQDAARPAADGSQDLVSPAGSDALSSQDAPPNVDRAASLADAPPSVDALAFLVDAEATISDAARSADSADDQLTRKSCVTAEEREQMYPASPCPGTGWYLFTDTRCYLCGPSDPLCSSRGYYCNPWGDQRCYRECKTSADCTNPCTPFCRQIVLFSGADHCGATTHSVCLHMDRNSCGDIPSQSN